MHVQFVLSLVETWKILKLIFTHLVNLEKRLAGRNKDKLVIIPFKLKASPRDLDTIIKE